MPLTVYVTQEVKEFVEGYIREQNPKREHGGFLLGRNYEAILPRFFPNMSSTPERSFSLPSDWRKMLQCDKNLFKMDWDVFFHTHPSHSIVSQADLQSASFFGSIELLIMYDDQKNSFSWRAFDAKAIEQYIEVIDKKYPVFQQYFANTLNLLNIGSCYITPQGEVLCSNQLGRAFIVVDMDALNLYNLIKPRGRIAKKEMRAALGMSLLKLDKCLKKLEDNKLI